MTWITFGRPAVSGRGAALGGAVGRGYYRWHAAQINGVRVSAEHQPELTVAWFDLLAEFRADARLDRVFGSTLF